MSRLRTFIAVALDPALRNRCVALQEKLDLLGAAVKWVEPENMHATLLFIGEVDERAVLDVCSAVSKVCAAHEPFTMSVETVGCFPNARRPRTIWAGVGEGAAELSALHDALEPPLLDLGCYRRESRQYTPHITLGRVTGEPADDGFANGLTKYAAWQGGEVDVREVLVLTSQLTRTGPIYGVLSRGRLRKARA